MVDPHRYFEQKLTGELRAAQTEAEEDACLATLLGWLDDGLLEPSQRSRLEAELAGLGLPGTTLAAGRPDVLRILLSGDRSPGAQSRLRETLTCQDLAPGDRQLILARLAGRT